MEINVCEEKDTARQFIGLKVQISLLVYKDLLEIYVCFLSDSMKTLRLKLHGTRPTFL
jgi:hypothetical protein